MADISVTLVLDDSQYTGKLVAAGTAADNFGNKAKEAGEKAKGGFEQLGLSVEGLNKKLELLTGALLGTGLLEFAKSAMEFADRVEDMAKATGMSIPEILEFQQAVRAAGGNAEGAAKGIQNFFAKIDEARQGSGQLQYAFQRLNISLGDLANMSDKQIFKKAIEELAALPPGAEQARLATELLGKTFKGLSIQEVAEKLKELKGQYDDQGPAVKAAADAQKRLEEEITNLKLAALNVFQPFIEQIGKLIPDAKTAEGVIRMITSAMAAFIALQAAEKIMILGKALVQATIAMYEFGAGTRSAAAAMTALGGPLSILLKIAVAAAAYFGVSYLLEESSKKQKEANEKETESMKKKQEELDKLTAGTKTVVDAYASARQAIIDQTNAFFLNIDLTTKKIEEDNKLIGSTQEVIKATQARLQVETEFAKKIQELEAKIAEAKKAAPGSQQSAELPTLVAQLQRVKDAEAGVAQTRQNLARATVDLTNKENDRMKGLADTYQLNQNILKLQDQYANSKLSGVIAQNKAIEQSWRDIANAEIEAIKQANAGYISAERQAEIIGRAQKNAEQEIKTNTELYKKQQADFSGGWAKSWNDYADAAADGFKTAQEWAGKFQTGLEDVFVNFAKTGKLSFSSLIDTMIEEFIRFEVRAMASQVWKMFAGAGSGGDGGGLLSGLGSLLGFADGGTIPTNAPVLVGENGPEIISGASGKTVTPNDAIGGGGQTNHTYNYTIQALDSRSVAQLFSENRQLLFGTVEQARKEMPFRQR